MLPNSMVILTATATLNRVIRDLAIVSGFLMESLLPLRRAHKPRALPLAL
jgi:hypothetical protein